ncbi:hypothetical protein [Sphingopyxis sp. QXT-31]|nr:hypothetical protein [Sphingopyxis sp. QXT-31]
MSARRRSHFIFVTTLIFVGAEAALVDGCAAPEPALVRGGL